MLRIKDLREDNDYTQEEIAQLLNCKQNTYQQYESEKRQIPIDALKKLAELYKTSLDFNSDVCGFGKYAITNFLETKDWDNYNWLESYKNSIFNINFCLYVNK